MKANIILESFSFCGDDVFKLYFKGKIFFDQVILEPEEILEGLKNDKELFLNKISGFYSLVYIGPTEIIASVDIIRSIPLFYSYDEAENIISISENTDNLIHNKNHNKINEDIFQLCSYVIGDETLYNNINQVQAGKYLLLKEDTCKQNVFFEFKANNLTNFDENSFLEKLSTITKKSFQKMFEQANGRQIVIPLSGGYDSRLIISVLKELNYNNVVCFSYGVRGNKEAEYSKRIAESLGYKWFFIEYTDEKWKKSWGSELAIKYINYAKNETSLPHVQDWLAVKEIKENHLVDDDCIFVPGHCCVTAYIEKEIVDIYKQKEEIFINSIINRHFNLCPISELKVINSKEDLIKIINLKIKNDYNSNTSLVSNVMAFNWRERQSKYIANSVRVYEIFGYNWWLPLWDKEFVELWINFPDYMRVDRVLFKKFVSEKYSRVSGIPYDLGNAKSSSLLYKFISYFLNKVPFKLKNYIKSLYRKNEYENHYLQFGSLVDNSLREDLTHKGYKIMGIYSYCILNNIWIK